MRLDIATLSFILFITSIIQVIGIYFQRKLNKSFKGTRYWVLGNIFNAIGVLLFFIRPFILNKFISMILPNLIVVSAQILIYIGITLFLNKKVKMKIIILIFFIFITGFFYFTVFVISISVSYFSSFGLIIMVNQRVKAEEIEAKKKFELIFQISPDAIDISRLEDGLIIEANDMFFSITGFAREDLIGNTTINLGLWKDLEERKKFIKLLRKNKCCENYEMELKKKDGTIFIGLTSSRVVEFNGEKYALNLIRDITDRKTIEKIIKRNEEKFKLASDKINVLSQAIEQSPASIVITDLTGRIEYVNKKFTEITGYSKEEAIEKNPRMLKSDYHSKEDYEKLWRSVLNGQEWRGEFQNKKKDGEFYWESAIISPIFNSEGEIEKIIAVKEDISERKRLENALKKQARTDGLTGLSNRRYFVEAVENELIRNKRYPKECAFLMLDIDHFKMVNDNFGHAIGDIALKKIADVFIETVRKTDILGRIGGEEFGILLVETNFENAIEIAERLRINVENIKLFDDKGVQVNLTISIGITKYTRERNSIEELMISSDRALYKAKNEGRNRVVAIE